MGIWATPLAAKKAFIVNRVGDFGFLIAAFTDVLGFRHALIFDEVFEQAPEVAAAAPGVILAITLFMLVGVAGKSAQIPAVRLAAGRDGRPDPGLGPDPCRDDGDGGRVSGRPFGRVVYPCPAGAVYRLRWWARSRPSSPRRLRWGSMISRRCWPIRPSASLGFMVAAVGMGAFVAGMFHLVTHAFFKALLFLSAGSVILGVERGQHHVEHDAETARKHDQRAVRMTFDPQDMRNMGGLRKPMPVTFWVYLIGALALAGIAPLAGFWSKDEILAGGQPAQPSRVLAVDDRCLLHRLLHGPPDLDGLLWQARAARRQSTPRKARR